jgi:prolyl-tRNA synthetase
MRTSQYLLTTQKETPADAEITSHKLMLRAGMIQKLSAGIYTWLPLGLRVLKKVENIVREEMNRINALEILMPAVQPAELWQETHRWEQFGNELLKIQDRHQRQFCFGPTHEEVVTDLVRRDIRSYKQLPLTVYQIQTKFRDEIRPRFGVMRAREFTMKDAYSFHIDSASLETTYNIMYQAYSTILTRLGLTFRAVLADTGSIGGNFSHEFHALAESGEDLLAFSDIGPYAANVERAEGFFRENRPAPNLPMTMIETPGHYTIEAVSQFLNIPPQQSVKTLLVEGADDDYIALVLRGDHELNPVKIGKLKEIAQPMRLISPDTIEAKIGCKPGSIGPVGLKCKIIVDRDAANLADFVCGSNKDDHHLQGVNWERDLPLPEIADLRQVVAGEMSPDGIGKLQFARGIELGHIFQLGNKYSVAMSATVLNDQGKATALMMGCYGIGVSRIVAAAIEQSHDERGIIWPFAMAPFHIAIVPVNAAKSLQVQEVCLKIYQELTQAGWDVLFDDRDERPGVMFADMDLIGIPHRLVISEKGLQAGMIEYKGRTDAAPRLIPLADYFAEVRDVIANQNRSAVDLT